MNFVAAVENERAAVEGMYAGMEPTHPLPWGEGRGEGQRMAKGLTKTARTLRKNQTDAERVLWQRLRNRQLLGVKFRRQMPIGDYVADFASVEIKLIIEVDGSQHFDNQTADACRTGFLQREGYKVVRFWNNDVLSRTDAVLEAIIEAMSCGHFDTER